MACLNKTSECCSGLPLLNLTAEEDAADYILQNGIGRTMLIVLYATLAVGIPGNLAFLFVVARVPYMRTTTNVYLSSLAVFDLMFLLSSVVEYTFYFTHPVRSHLSTALAVGCLGAFMPPYVAYFGSLFMVSLVSLDRYSAICRPFRRVNVVKAERVRKNMTLVLGSSIVAVGLAGLAMFRFAKLNRYCAVWPASKPYENLTVHLGYCQATGHWGLIVGHVLESVVFIIAVLVNGASYTSIIIHLNNRAKRKRERRPVAPSVQAHRALHIRNQVAFMLVTNAVVFFLCQAPFVAVSLWFLVEHLAGIPSTATYRKLVSTLTVCHAFVFLNSAVNPIIYNVTSRHYRQAFVDAFSWSRPKHVVKTNAEDKNIAESPRK